MALDDVESLATDAETAERGYLTPSIISMSCSNRRKGALAEISSVVSNQAELIKSEINPDDNCCQTAARAAARGIYRSSQRKEPLVKSLATAFILLGLCLSAQTARAGELPSQIQAGQHRLVLNGEGARTKAFLQLYVAGLYLTQSNNNATQIIAAEQPMAIRIKITSGFVSQSSLVESLEEGFNKATNGDLREIRQEIDQFRKCFTDEIAKGDNFDLVYVPTHGVIVNKNGKYMDTIAGTKFKQALFSIWLSNQPADADLKQALLTTSKIR